MVQMVENGVEYTIEFVKLILVVQYMMGYKLNKRVFPSFAAGLCGIMLVTVLFQAWRLSFVLGVLVIVAVVFCVSGEKAILKVILCFTGISVVDMAIGSLAFYVMDVDIQRVDENGTIMLLINSVSLLLLIIYACMAKRRAKEPFHISNKMMPVYLAAAIFLSLFVALLELLELGEDVRLYRNELVVILNVNIIIFVLVCIISNRNQNENELLKLENKMNENMLESQRDYYLMLLKKEMETKAFRHDIREQIACIRLLYDKKEYEGLGQYISEIEQRVLELSPKYNTGNDFVSAIINDLTGRFPAVDFRWEGRVPMLKLSYMDTCTLFYNLLKNAFEAAVETEEKKVEAVAKVYDGSVILLVSNSYTEIRQDETGELISTKEGKDHGYGVGNMKRCIASYHGSCEYRIEGSIFVAKVVLPDVAQDEKKNERSK